MLKRLKIHLSEKHSLQKILPVGIILLCVIRIKNEVVVLFNIYLDFLLSAIFCGPILVSKNNKKIHFKSASYFLNLKGNNGRNKQAANETTNKIHFFFYKNTFYNYK